MSVPRMVPLLPSRKQRRPNVLPPERCRVMFANTSSSCERDTTGYEPFELDAWACRPPSAGIRVGGGGQGARCTRPRTAQGYCRERRLRADAEIPSTASTYLASTFWSPCW